MNVKKVPLALAIFISLVGINLYSPLAANACGRFDVGCKIKEKAKKVREASYRVHPYFIQALVVTRVAKNKGLIKGNDCRDIVETGSWAGAGAAAASGVASSISILVKVVGKESGNLMCSDAGM